MREYSALKLTLIPTGARIAAPEGPDRVTLDDPAFAVMTDLRNVPAASTSPAEIHRRLDRFRLLTTGARTPRGRPLRSRLPRTPRAAA